MRTSSLFLRALLRNACWDTTGTLEESLKAALTGTVSTSANGKQVIYSSINGQSVTYQIPAGAGSPEDLTEAYEFLYELYELAVCALPLGTDADKCAWMRANLHGSSRINPDFQAAIFK